MPDFKSAVLLVNGIYICSSHTRSHTGNLKTGRLGLCALKSLSAWCSCHVGTCKTWTPFFKAIPLDLAALRNMAPCSDKSKLCSQKSRNSKTKTSRHSPQASCLLTRPSTTLHMRYLRSCLKASNNVFRTMGLQSTQHLQLQRAWHQWWPENLEVN